MAKRGRHGFYTFADQVAAFWAKTRQEGECLVWTGSTNKPIDPLRGTGHGEIRLRGKKVRVTHLAFFLGHGRWPTAGMHILHSCHNPPCVRLTHLREGTPKDNAADRSERKRQRSEEQRNDGQG